MCPVSSPASLVDAWLFRNKSVVFDHFDALSSSIRFFFILAFSAPPFFFLFFPSIRCNTEQKQIRFLFDCKKIRYFNLTRFLSLTAAHSSPYVHWINSERYAGPISHEALLRPFYINVWTKKKIKSLANLYLWSWKLCNVWVKRIRSR